MATAGVTNWSIPKRWLWKLPIFHQTAARALHPQDEHCMGHQVPCVSQLWPAWGPPQASVFPPHSLLAQRCDSTPQKHASLFSYVSVFFYQVNSCEGMKCDRSYLHDTLWISLSKTADSASASPTGLPTATIPTSNTWRIDIYRIVTAA